MYEVGHLITASMTHLSEVRSRLFLSSPPYFGFRMSNKRPTRLPSIRQSLVPFAYKGTRACRDRIGHLTIVPRPAVVLYLFTTS